MQKMIFIADLVAS